MQICISFSIYKTQNKTLSQIELNAFLEYNVNEVIKYYNQFKEDEYGFKKDTKRYLAK